MKWSEMGVEELFRTIQKRVTEAALKEKLIEEEDELEFLLDGENRGIYMSIWECYNDDILIAMHDTDNDTLRIQKYTYEWFMPCILEEGEI